jgi:hypothetical protein
VTTANKIALGPQRHDLDPRTHHRAHHQPAVLTLQSAANLSAYLRYRDSAASVSVKAKPYGVTACQVFGMTSAAPITLSFVPRLQASALPPAH